MRTRGFEWISEYEGCGLTLPSRKTSSSAGYDIAAAADTPVPAGCITIVPTGLKAYMPQDEYLAVHIRSGLSIKNGLSLINGQGIIDSDYYNNPDNEGHILIALWNHSDTELIIEKGTRIAQGIFQPYYRIDNDQAVLAVRKGGFGSTGSV